jgi:hypothetical protein
MFHFRLQKPRTANWITVDFDDFSRPADFAFQSSYGVKSES